MFVVKEESVLANKFPELTAEWDFEKNGELKPTKRCRKISFVQRK